MKAPNQPISQQTTSPAGRNRQFFSYSALAAAVALSLGGITAIAKTSATLPESAPLTTVSVWETAGLTQLFQVFRFQILR